MTKFSVQLPAGDTVTLDLDLDTTTVAAVKATVDARLEPIWRASGVRILRSDLPFRGVDLHYRNGVLATERVLSGCDVGENATLYAQWAPKDEKNGRRKRYGKGWDGKPVLERRMRGGEGKGRDACDRALDGAAERRISAQCASETGADEQDINASSSDDRPVEDVEVEPDGDRADVGGEAAQILSRGVVGEAQHEQQMEEEVQEERTTEEVERHDQFADDDSNKENREPFALVVQSRVDRDPVEEWSGFDESNSGIGIDLLEEVLDF